ncbi:MAG: hypothetical protein CW691_06965 [Candidatus Bathyarchaeum sp.]|nr:MAG: hypothetical protein CW691_06965 [Candidatus Bathyarchaeum sp.]
MAHFKFSLVIFIYRFSQIGIMKGISLPINVLVIVVIAVIVLLGVVSVYFTSWSPFGESMNAESAKTAGCRRIINNCDLIGDDFDDYAKSLVFDGLTGLPSFDVNGNDEIGDEATESDDGDTMFNLCRTFFGTDCRKLCGCQ